MLRYIRGAQNRNPINHSKGLRSSVTNLAHSERTTSRQNYLRASGLLGLGFRDGLTRLTIQR